MEDSEKAPPARFADRFNAFLLDASLFSSGYFLSAFVAAFVFGGEPFRGFFPAWILLWTALFIAYHAYYAADDRRTLGKRLLGIQVVTVDDELPNLKISLTRAIAYLPSSLFFFAGFLWALKGGRAWHDHISGTWVAQVDERSKMTQRMNTVVAGLLALLLVAGWFVIVVIGPSMARGKLIAHGEKGVKSVIYLEGKYRAANGVYTADPEELFKSSEEAAQIAKELPLYIDMATLKIQAGPEGLVVEASALDEKRTVLTAQVK